MLKLHFMAQKAAWATLHARRARLPHAILIHGPAGVGKGEFALAAAAALLCESPHGDDGSACGHCPACTWFQAGNHPDFRSLQPAALGTDAEAEPASAGKKKPSREITIDQIRALEDFLQVGAHRQGRRIVLINPAEAMNRNTANALLKSLEEPGPDTLFLLVTHRYEQLLPTVRSRCQGLALHCPSEGESLAWLNAEGIDDAGRWLGLAGGAPLAAAALARDRPLSEMTTTVRRHLANGASLSPVDAAADLDKQLKAIQGSETLQPMRSLIDSIQRWCVDLARVRAGLAPQYDRTATETLKKVSHATPLARIVGFQRLLVAHKRLSEHPLNSKLLLEEVFMQYRAAFSGEKIDGR